jgi:hypothetical protein
VKLDFHESGRQFWSFVASTDWDRTLYRHRSHQKPRVEHPAIVFHGYRMRPTDESDPQWFPIDCSINGYSLAGALGGGWGQCGSYSHARVQADQFVAELQALGDSVRFDPPQSR